MTLYFYQLAIFNNIRGRVIFIQIAFLKLLRDALFSLNSQF